MNYSETRKKVFSSIIGLYPLLSVYGSSSLGVDLSSILLILFFISCINLKINRSELNPIIIYILFVTPFVNLLLNYSNVSASTVFIRYGKMMITLFIVFVFGYRKKYYDESITIDTIKKVVFINAAFIIIQRITNIFGFVLANPFLHYSINEAYDVQQSYVSSYLFRPSGFFLEPSHMVVYMLPFVCYCLFEKDDIKGSAIAAIAIVCSGSGMGIVSILGLYAVYYIVKFRKNFIRVLLLIVISIALVGCLSRVPFIQQSIMRFTTDNVEHGGNAIQARLGTGYTMFYYNPNVIKILGFGYGNIPPNMYFNGFAYMLNTLGLVGTVIYVCALIKDAYVGEMWKKIGIVLLICLTIYSQTFNPSMIVYCFCLYSSENKHFRISVKNDSLNRSVLLNQIR